MKWLCYYVSSIYFWRSTALKSGGRAIFTFLQDLFQVSILMTLGMSNIPIQNKDGLYFFSENIYIFFEERCGKGMKGWLYFVHV